MKLFSGTVFLLCCCFCAFSRQPLLHITNDLETDRRDFPWINYPTVIEGSAASGSHFSRTDAMHAYGMGYKGEFPDACRSRNLRIVCSERIRSDKRGNKYQLVFNVFDQDSVVIWEGVQLDKRLKTADTWTLISDTLLVPRNMTGPGYRFAFFLWNEDGGAVVDEDDIELTFEEYTLPSFVPSGISVNDTIAEYAFSPVYTGKFFRLDYDKSSGHLHLFDAKKKVLFDAVSFYTAWDQTDGRRVSHQESRAFKFYLKADSLAEDGKYLHFQVRNPVGESDVYLRFDNDEPVLEFRVSTRFSRDLSLQRQSILFRYKLPVEELFRSTSLSDTSFFQDEYWLGQGGCLWGDSSSSLLIQHPEHVSSMQIMAAEKVFVVNLDYAADHPLLRWPLLKKGLNVKQDCSPAVYKSGQVLNSNFTFYTNAVKRTYPRLMNQAGGYSATLIWTEHADFTDLRTHRAVYFGADTIHSSLSATGGFIGHKIPVTKSVFYSNPDHVMNSEKAGFVNTEIANIESTPGFRELLRDLDSNGIEICLHTPDHFTTSRPRMEAALKYTADSFHSVTWIDHGYDNALTSNREDLVCDGLDSTSSYYAADLWKRYGIRSAWNCFYEDSSVFSKYAYQSFLSNPYSGWGDAFPVPDWWKHPTRSGNLVHWRTTSTLDPPDGSMWGYYFNEQRLNDLVALRSLDILHAYPARIDSTNGFYEYRNGTFTVHPEFDRMLGRLAAYREKRLINLSTIRDWQNYQQQIMQVKYINSGNGNLVLKNTGDRPIRDFALAVKATQVHVSRKNISARQDATDLIFWFDLDAGEQVEIDWK